MAELQDIFNSGDLTELNLGGSLLVKDTINNVIIQSNSNSSDINTLEIRADALDTAVLGLTAAYNDLRQFINTGVSLGPSLSLVECQTHIPSPNTNTTYILKGTTNYFMVVYQNGKYLWERLSIAT